MRSRICDGLGFLGLSLDDASNAANAAVISAGTSRVIVRVIRTDEELMIAKTVFRLLGNRPGLTGERHGTEWPNPGAVIATAQGGRRLTVPSGAWHGEPFVPGTAARGWTPTGGRRIICRSARSTCSTTRCLKEPLRLEHIKPRLLGHWGTTPGLNFIYVHLNRVIKEHDLDMIYVCGPGHGGPGMVANAYLEGTYSEVYPNIAEDEAGMKRLFTQFSFPGGIPSHVAPETPGSIHEGGELGYSLSHAFGAAFDNPDLIVACVVGDGEAETGALATGWHSNKFLNPATDGAVLPILHLNG